MPASTHLRVEAGAAVTWRGVGPMQDLQLIVKVARGCNLRCTYCYAGNYRRQRLKLMPREILERLTSQALAIASRRVEFCWHGGEPLLAGRDFFLEAIELQNRFRQPEQKIVNSLQTNGLLVDESWVSFFEDHDFGPGVSMDGPPFIHDNQRPRASGVGSHSRVMEALHLWQSRGHNIPILCVVTSTSAQHPDELFEFFVQSNLRTFDFLPCSKINPSTGRVFDAGVSAPDFARFMLRMFDRWWSLDDPGIRIRFFDNVLQGLMGGRPSLCNVTGACRDFLTVDTDGTVYPCDDFAGDSSFAYGNILDTDVATLLNGPRRAWFVEEVAKVGTACASCNWFTICKGGCSYYRYMRNGRFDDANYYCETRKTLFKHITGLASPVADLVRRRLAESQAVGRA